MSSGSNEPLLALRGSVCPEVFMQIPACHWTLCYSERMGLRRLCAQKLLVWRLLY